MAKKNDSGFQSSAGLMRYFDVENEKGIRISPRAVIGIAIGLVVVVMLLEVFYPLNCLSGPEILWRTSALTYTIQPSGCDSDRPRRHRADCCARTIKLRKKTDGMTRRKCFQILSSGRIVYSS